MCNSGERCCQHHGPGIAGYHGGGGCCHHHTPGERGHHPGHSHGDCGCHPHRRFPTREEELARLEDYLKGLQAEAKGVEERIGQVKREAAQDG